MNKLLSLLTAFVGSGLFLILAGILVLLGISYFRLEKQHYVIELVVFDENGQKSVCDPSYLNLMRENFRIEAIAQMADAVTVRSQQYGNYMRVVSTLDNTDLSENLSETSPYLKAARNFLGIRPKTINIYAFTSKSDCNIKIATIISDDNNEFRYISKANQVAEIASMVVDAIDPFIEISEAAYDSRRLYWSRSETFLKISEGRDAVWYKNLAGVTYLQETDLYDAVKNVNIIRKLNESARFWFNESLKEDPRFLPAIFNLQGIYMKELEYSDESYQCAIDALMRIHWREGCPECVARTARLRFDRFERHRTAKTLYSRQDEDLRFARALLEWKVVHHGASRNDFAVLSRVVNAQETSTYQEYLSTVAQSAVAKGSNRRVRILPPLNDDPISEVSRSRN